MVDEAISAAGWLRRADAWLVRYPDLEHAARGIRGFGGGGAWMIAAMATIRGRPIPAGTAPFVRLGVTKYAKCAAAAFGAFTATVPWGVASALVLAVLAFYAAEARSVFVFPATIDFGRRGRKAAAALHRRAGGTITVMTRVLPIAAFMVFGWIANGRPRRNFALGCLAIVLWYESLRHREASTPCVVELGATAPLTIRRIGASHGAAGANGDATAVGPTVTRVLYASDLHLGAWGSERAMRDLLRITIRERPDVVLLGGDLVDARRALPELSAWIRRLARFAVVGAVPGNHDSRIAARVEAAVVAGGGHWLLDRPLRLAGLRIDGSPTPPSTRAERRLLCAHHPARFTTAVASNYDYVLAGHLHGGQAIVADVGGRHYPGALLSRWTGPTFVAANTTMWVSRGVADTLPIRFRCPREVLLVTVSGAESSHCITAATTALHAAFAR